MVIVRFNGAAPPGGTAASPAPPPLKAAPRDGPPDGQSPEVVAAWPPGGGTKPKPPPVDTTVAATTAADTQRPPASAPEPSLRQQDTPRPASDSPVPWTPPLLTLVSQHSRRPATPVPVAAAAPTRPSAWAPPTLVLEPRVAPALTSSGLQPDAAVLVPLSDARLLRSPPANTAVEPDERFRRIDIVLRATDPETITQERYDTDLHINICADTVADHVEGIDERPWGVELPRLYALAQVPEALDEIDATTAVGHMLPVLVKLVGDDDYSVASAAATRLADLTAAVARAPPDQISAAHWQALGTAVAGLCKDTRPDRLSTLSAVMPRLCRLLPENVLCTSVLRSLTLTAQFGLDETRRAGALEVSKFMESLV